MDKAIDWILRIVPSAILFQTLFFKFTGTEESIYIFSTLGIEPWGRYLIAVLELMCVVFFLLPKTPVLGALISMGVIAGAIVAHLLRLGIEVKGDGGLLFLLAVIVLLCNVLLLFKRRLELLNYLYRSKP